MNISEVAKLAGVSSATVSRYFNHGYLSDEKREAIRRVVEETGYKPSLQAQTLRTRKSRTVGVILPKLDSSSLSRVTSGILTTLNANHYHVLMADTQNDPAKEIEYLKTLRERQVDGIILIATVFTPEHRKALKDLPIPIVIEGQEAAHYDCVFHDDYHAMYDMTSLVLGKGRKNLGYIGVLEQDEAAGAKRYQGFSDAVTEAGLGRLRANYVIAGFSIREGYDGARMLLDRHPDLDAIICATDAIAAGCMRYLREQGIVVPDQVMVTGHEDSMIAHVITPTLTTIHYSYEESGAAAANILLERLSARDDGENKGLNHRIIMPYSIIEQESTGAAGNMLPDKD